MNCVLCGRNSGIKPSSLSADDAFSLYCPTCGVFTVEAGLTRRDAFDDPKLSPLLYRLSAQTKASIAPLRIDQKRLNDLLEGVPRDKTVPDKVELQLRWLAEHSAEVGDQVPTVLSRDYPAAWCRSEDEWGELLKYLRKTGLVEIDSVNNPGWGVTLTEQGWQRLHELPKATGSKVFIAMAFDPTLDDVKAAIQRAIEGAGYDPLRVDDDHYSGGVIDRIITHIRDSKFIVADFTKNRGGVYYEAGVAFGLGIDVVNVCDAECLKDGASDRLHFDVRHLVFVPWEKDQLAQFTEDLRTHIIAVHGRGPRPST